MSWHIFGDMQTVQTQFRTRSTLFADRNLYVKCSYSESIHQQPRKLEMDSSKDKEGQVHWAKKGECPTNRNISCRTVDRDDFPTMNSMETGNPVNLMYTDRLFHCYMLDKSICHFMGVRSIWSLVFYF